MLMTSFRYHNDFKIKIENNFEFGVFKLCHIPNLIAMKVKIPEFVIFLAGGGGAGAGAVRGTVYATVTAVIEEAYIIKISFVGLVLSKCQHFPLTDIYMNLELLSDGATVPTSVTSNLKKFHSPHPHYIFQKGHLKRFTVDREYHLLCPDIAPTFTVGSFWRRIVNFTIKSKGYCSQAVATKHQNLKDLTRKCLYFPLLF